VVSRGPHAKRPAACRATRLLAPVAGPLALDLSSQDGTAAYRWYAYQAATLMCGDHGMGVDLPWDMIVAFVPGRR
jgi:hypothetical protein